MLFRSSHLYSGDSDAAQAMVHREDMIDAFVRTVDRRDQLPDETVILIGESDAVGYDDLQDRLGSLIHGEDDWAPLRPPSSMAGVGAWPQDQAEPLIHDALEQRERTFNQPFTTRIASVHYAHAVSRAHTLLRVHPTHRNEMRRVRQVRL